MNQLVDSKKSTRLLEYQTLLGKRQCRVQNGCLDFYRCAAPRKKLEELGVAKARALVILLSVNARAASFQLVGPPLCVFGNTDLDSLPGVMRSSNCPLNTINHTMGREFQQEIIKMRLACGYVYGELPYNN